MLFVNSYITPPNAVTSASSCFPTCRSATSSNKTRSHWYPTGTQITCTWRFLIQHTITVSGPLRATSKFKLTRPSRLRGTFYRISARALRLDLDTDCSNRKRRIIGTRARDRSTTTHFIQQYRESSGTGSVSKRKQSDDASMSLLDFIANGSRLLSLPGR